MEDVPGKNHKTTQEDIDFLAECYRRGLDMEVIGELIGLKSRSTRRWIKKIQENNGNTPLLRKRGGAYHKIVTKEMKDRMIQMVEEKTDITLEEIRTQILSEFPAVGKNKLCLSTIWNHLDGELITTKEIRYVAAQANSPENLQARINYVNEISRLDNEILKIYIDETNITILTRRKIGRSRAETRAVRHVPLNGCSKINIIHSVCANIGNVYTEKDTTSLNAERFETYIMNLINHLKNNFPEQKCCLIMDNAPIHRQNKIREIISCPENQNKYSLIMLPKYSPFLNPIENVFSQLKSEIKKYLRNNNQQLIDAANLPWKQKSVRRFQILQDALETSLQAITSQNVANYELKTTSYYAAIMTRQFINE